MPQQEKGDRAHLVRLETSGPVEEHLASTSGTRRIAQQGAALRRIVLFTFGGERATTREAAPSCRTCTSPMSRITGGRPLRLPGRASPMRSSSRSDSLDSIHGASVPSTSLRSANAVSRRSRRRRDKAHYETM